MAVKYQKGWVRIKVKDLVLANWNYKDEGDTKKREEMLMTSLQQNIKRNGVIENILVRQLDSGFYEVVNGNHRVKVIESLGIDEVMCFNLGKISLIEAKRVAIETNETKFAANRIKLAETVSELLTDFDLDDILNTTPFDEAEIEDFNKLLEFDWDALESKEDEEEKEDLDKRAEGEQDQFAIVKVTVTKELKQEFEFQMERYKKMIFPDLKIDEVSPIEPFKAMLNIIKSAKIE